MSVASSKRRTGQRKPDFRPLININRKRNQRRRPKQKQKRRPPEKKAADKSVRQNLSTSCPTKVEESQNSQTQIFSNGPQIRSLPFFQQQRHLPSQPHVDARI